MRKKNVINKDFISDLIESLEARDNVLNVTLGSSFEYYPIYN